MKVLVYGSLNIDILFSVNHIVCPGETIASESFAKNAGGKGANQAAALAKAGLPVYMAGKIGRDGQFLLRLLESYGVNTGRVIEYEGETGQAIIQLDAQGQNAIVLHHGGNGAITVDEIRAAIAEFSAGDIIVLQNEIAHLRPIMEIAHRQGMRICLNPSPYNETIAALPLELAHWLFVNEIEGAALAGLAPQADPPAALERLVECLPATEIIVTAGVKGAFYGFGAIRAQRDSVSVPVVDTTAAGDTFTGYFIAARERHMPVPQALTFACTAAAITVSRAGAMESIPLCDEVVSQLQFPNNSITS